MHEQPARAAGPLLQRPQTLRAVFQPAAVQRRRVLHQKHRRLQPAALHQRLPVRLQNVLATHLVIVQEAVGRLLLGAAGEDRRQRLARMPLPGRPQPLQPPPQAPVGQVRALELAPRPTGLVVHRGCRFDALHQIGAPWHRHNPTFRHVEEILPCAFGKRRHLDGGCPEPRPTRWNDPEVPVQGVRERRQPGLPGVAGSDEHGQLAQLDGRSGNRPEVGHVERQWARSGQRIARPPARPNCPEEGGTGRIVRRRFRRSLRVRVVVGTEGRRPDHDGRRPERSAQRSTTASRTCGARAARCRRRRCRRSAPASCSAPRRTLRARGRAGRSRRPPCRSRRAAESRRRSR